MMSRVAAEIMTWKNYLKIDINTKKKENLFEFCFLCENLFENLTYC